MSTFGSDKYPYGTSQVKTGKAEIAKRIRSAGAEQNFNASSLSKAINIPRSTMQKYWSGDRMVGSELVFLIADTLKVNPRWLITGLGSKIPAAEFDPDKAGEEERLLFAFRHLTGKEQAHVLETAELLAKLPVAQLPADEKTQSTLHSQKQDYKGPDSD